MVDARKKRIAIIGAGPSGISQLLAFKQSVQEQRVELVCFERQSDWGGIWHYTAQTGTDAYGEPIHSSMYRQLWSNGPKEILEFADYSFEHHFGRSISSFPPRAVLYDYLIGRAQAGDIRKFIRFRTAVRHIDFDAETQQFQVTVEDLLVSGIFEHLTFDYVIVAAGHYSVPNMPDFEGVPRFLGRVLHSHDFRGADEFVNQNLLIIGGSYSAEDIAMQCYKFGARSITICYRTIPMGFNWPANIREVPMLQRVQGRSAYFKDGTQVDDLDCIIVCTGFRYHLPFMAEHLRLRCSNNLFVPPNLYKGLFWISQPRLAYIGMQNQTYTFTLFDAQAALVRDVFLGQVELPAGTDEAACRADIAAWQACEAAVPLGDHIAASYVQSAYIQDILSYCEPSTAPMLEFDRIDANIKKFLTDKVKDISTYRDESYPSAFHPYKQAPVSRTPWMKATDDSMETYFASLDDST